MGAHLSVQRESTRASTRPAGKVSSVLTLTLQKHTGRRARRARARAPGVSRCPQPHFAARSGCANSRL
eukprot:5668017-Pleurochrysis_carterae.AAC.1